MYVESGPSARLEALEPKHRCSLLISGEKIQTNGPLAAVQEIKTIGICMVSSLSLEYATDLRRNMMRTSECGCGPTKSRTRSIIHIVGLAWTILLLASCLGASEVAEYMESYAKGLEAYENEQWTEATEWFRQAIEERPEAGGEVVALGESRVYAPYHQLALALYFDDALEEAELMWSESAAQGVVAKGLPGELERIEQYRADIAARLEERKEVRQAVDKQLLRADRQIVLLDEPRLQLVLDRDTNLAQSRQTALEKLDQARRLQGHPQADENQLSEAHALAVQSAALLESIVLKATRLAISEEEGP